MEVSVDDRASHDDIEETRGKVRARTRRRDAFHRPLNHTDVRYINRREQPEQLRYQSLRGGLGREQACCSRRLVHHGESQEDRDDVPLNIQFHLHWLIDRHIIDNGYRGTARLRLN